MTTPVDTERLKLQAELRQVARETVQLQALLITKRARMQTLLTTLLAQPQRMDA